MSIFRAATAALLLSATAASAGPALWGIDLAGADGLAERIDPATGAILQSVDLGAVPASGIAIVGNTGYFTSSSDGFIRSFNTTTGAVSSTLTATTSASGFGSGYGSASFDGSGFWVNDGSNGNKAFHITLAGVTDRSVTLSLCNVNCGGLDYYTIGGRGVLVASEDAIGAASTSFDVYGLDGAVLRAGVIKNVADGAGIVWTNNAFLVSTSDGSIISYDLTGTQTGKITTPGAIFADLSIVPEPASLALLAGGLAALPIARRRRR